MLGKDQIGCEIEEKKKHTRKREKMIMKLILFICP